MASHQFQTEVNQLLHLIIHSLYSHKEIYLRELISNSSDALDKLKYLTISDDQFKSMSFDPKINIEFSEGDNPTLTVRDNGLGMNESDLTENLGTIARSGTKNFLSQLSGDAKKDSNLIGQFGVGFYSAFMVADKIEVTSRKAGEDQAYKWTSDGKSGYEIETAERDEQGTTIVLHLNDEGKEYASRWSLESLIKKYSDHIAFPIFLHYTKVEYDDKGKEKSKEPAVDQVNKAQAIWRRSKSELKDEDYKEFYKSLAHSDEDPLHYFHTKAEGTLEYSTLFYIPKKAPADLFYADYKPGVKLYVKRVFITDDDKELLPSWLRFVRGVIDSEDLPLNVSREILQQNRVMSNIRSASVKKILGELKSMASERPDDFAIFTKEFNRPIKEGLYSDFAHREELMELVRFKSTAVDGYTSLADYVDRMKSDQKAIYYISGEKEAVLRSSPLLEAYKKKDFEVLIMDEEIDEIVIPTLGQYKEKDIKGVNRSDAAKDLKEKVDKKQEKAAKPLLERIKKVLGEKVKDVVVSARLDSSPSCIVLDESDPSYKLQAMMKAMGQESPEEIKPILEVNVEHPILVSAAKEGTSDEIIEDLSHVLYEQALMVEGMPVKDPAGFVKRMNKLVEKAL